MKRKKEDVFKAIADPRRRRIIRLLMVSSTLSLQAITANFDMSRQALSRHINTLSESGILKAKKQGRETLFYLDMKPMKQLFDEVNFYQSFWEESLDKLGDLINNENS